MGRDLQRPSGRPCRSQRSCNTWRQQRPRFSNHAAPIENENNLKLSGLAKTAGAGEDLRAKPPMGNQQGAAQQRRTSATTAEEEMPVLTGRQLAVALSGILTVHCARAASGGAATARCTPFHAAVEPEDGICDHLMKIQRRLKCSKECLILSLIYIDRVSESCSDIAVSNLTVHRLLLTGILLASKFQDDGGYDNAHYAQVGNMTVSELNGLESYFLRCLKWRLYVRPADYDWYHNLVRRVAV